MRSLGVIIVAAGTGNRMKSDIPKQFLRLNGKPILVHTLERIIESFVGAQIVVVISKQEQERWKAIVEEYDLADSHTVCFGGSTRFESVRNAVGVIGSCEFFAVHDGVRPLFSETMACRLMECAKEHRTAVPVVRAVDSFRVITNDGSAVIDRESLRAVQTPQIFEAGLLREAYGSTIISSVTDDASLVETLGVKIALCEGESENIKITTPMDIVYATEILKHRNNF